MLFRAKKNRRRLDVAKKTGELTAAAKSHAPTFFKVLALLVMSIGLTWGGREGWRWATTTERLSLRSIVVPVSRGPARPKWCGWATSCRAPT